MRTRTGIIGGAVGVIATGAAVAVAVDRSRRARNAHGAARADDDFVDGPATRHGVVVAGDGTGLYYEQVGADSAPLTVVFVHGFALCLRSFLFQRRALVEQFGDRIRMVFYDQRAHGRSDRSSADRASIDQLGRDLTAVLATVAPSGPLVLVGHSMGGMTILALADQQPEVFAERVHGVALLSTSTGKLAAVTMGLPALVARITGPVLPLLLRGARSQAALVERGRALGSDVAWVITRKLSFATEDIDPATVDFVTSMIAATRIEVIADYYPALMRHDKLRALDALRDTRVLIMCGDHDLLTPPEHSREMADRLPKATLSIVPNAGHLALIEDPGRTNEALAALVGEALDEVTGASRR
jgi:pimeloyl-ACP methyl ester carboxylesterase